LAAFYVLYRFKCSSVERGDLPFLSLKPDTVVATSESEIVTVCVVLGLDLKA